MNDNIGANGNVWAQFGTCSDLGSGVNVNVAGQVVTLWRQPVWVVFVVEIEHDTIGVNRRSSRLDRHPEAIRHEGEELAGAGHCWQNVVLKRD